MRVSALDTARILTIEDEPAVRNGIVAYLEDSGFEMLEAPDGAVGLDVFRREHPDAVLCDLRLPHVDGLDVLLAISTESPHTPVLIVSGANQVGDAVQALKRGAWDYVTKPIPDMAVLENALRRCLEKAELRRKNREYQQNLEELNQRLAETLRQLAEDQEAGRRIQFQLLPENNQRWGEYVFSRRLFPSMYLSGDFIDYFALDERYIALYIADVSGHGSASAFVTVMLKTLLQQYREGFRQDADPTALSPAATLERLDRDLLSQQLDKHLTIFYGVLDVQDHVLTCGSGGQFPYPIRSYGHEARFLTCRGRPIGLFRDSQFHETPLEMPPGSSLLLVSDGILELLPEPSLREKLDALRSPLTGNTQTLDEIIGRLGLKEIEDLPDDIALLMIHRHMRHVQR
jgi:sigma-B regulation protein RsbU (phosphoserine phosphatase)